MADEKLIYGVWLLKRNQDHICVLETDNFEEADLCWTELKARWSESLDTQKPFELRKPVITAFDPGLIYEITVVPRNSSTKVSSDNPYQKQMQDRGFAATFGNTSKGPSILDGGYSR